MQSSPYHRRFCTFVCRSSMHFYRLQRSFIGKPLTRHLLPFCSWRNSSYLLPSLPKTLPSQRRQSRSKAYAKSTSLEALGFLAPFVINPMRFLGRSVVVVTDNAAAALTLAKGYSTGDPWASTICRAARVVAAGLSCVLTAK